MSQVVGRPALLRGHNRALILRALRRSEPQSRADLAREIGLAMPTVSRLVDELVEQRLVEELGTADPRGGRPGTLLALRADGVYVLGADVGRHDIRVLVADLRARVLADSERGRGVDPESDIKIVAEEAERLLSELRLDRDRVVGMGIGVPGPMDTEHGVGLILNPPSLPGWSSVPVREKLAALLDMPIVVDNRANVAAYGEYLFCHHDVRAMVYVHAGVGIGAGLVLGGQLYRGRANAVGMIGHFAIDQDGPACRCGRPGCLEARASTGAMVAAYRNQDEPPDAVLPLFSDLLAAERSGDEAALEVLTVSGRALGTALGNLVNLLDPDLVVLDGEAVQSETYRAAAIEEMRWRTFTQSETDIQVELARLGSRVVTLGAAAVLFQRFFDSPLLAATQP